MAENIRRLAQQREEIHKNHASSRPLSVDYEYIGLMGEDAFADRFGLKVDTTLRPGGDHGRDFVIGDLVIDIKTARKAYNLIIEEGKVKDRVCYVLAQFTESPERIEFLGWEWGRVMKDQPVKDFGYGVKNHYKKANQLRDMALLEGAIKARFI